MVSSLGGGQRDVARTLNGQDASEKRVTVISVIYKREHEARGGKVQLEINDGETQT